MSIKRQARLFEETPENVIGFPECKHNYADGYPEDPETHTFPFCQTCESCLRFGVYKKRPCYIGGICPARILRKGLPLFHPKIRPLIQNVIDNADEEEKEHLRRREELIALREQSQSRRKYKYIYPHVGEPGEFDGQGY